MRTLIVLLVFFVILSGCEQTSQNLESPQLINNPDFDNENVVRENQELMNRINYLEEEVKQKNNTINNLIERLSEFYQIPSSKTGPYDRIKRENIQIYDDRIVIDLKEAIIADIGDTHSLEPLIDKDTNVIEIIPESPRDIYLGDLVAYESEVYNLTILHRVISVGKDEQGWFATMKGDNNLQPDPEKVRFSQVKSIVVGVVY